MTFDKEAVRGREILVEALRNLTDMKKARLCRDLDV
jgi:hypothetical protein